MKRLLLFVLFFIPGTFAQAQVSLTSSNLPIIIIDTEGKDIPDEPKIRARMKVIDNGPGNRNSPTDAPNAYNGWIGIEMRGSTSQTTSPKKPYAVETRDIADEDSSVSLLGFPKEADWVFYAPYHDKSLLRDELAYWISRRMGHYASRTRFFELIVNGDYKGIYILMERIKRDKSRVNISKIAPTDISGDKLTGGYIVKIDKWAGSDNEGWPSKHLANGKQIYYQYHVPKPADLAPQQKMYIQSAVAKFEDVMASPNFADPSTGYASVIDVPSFVDYFILTEVNRNVDGYRLSAFLYKDRDSINPKFFAGPAWDYNFAFGNADYYGAQAHYGLQVNFADPSDGWQVAFWWKKLAVDPVFARAAVDRYRELRTTVLHLDTLYQHIDEQVAVAREGTDRNFQRWPILNERFWPIPGDIATGTYPEHVGYLKQWIRYRLEWMDANLGKALQLSAEDPSIPLASSLTIAEPYPNPSDREATVGVLTGGSETVSLSLYDILGREVGSIAPFVTAPERWHYVPVDVQALPAGTYFLQVRGATASRTVRLTVAH